jgi:hypothetical protein
MMNLHWLLWSALLYGSAVNANKQLSSSGQQQGGIFATNLDKSGTKSVSGALLNVSGYPAF